MRFASRSGGATYLGVAFWEDTAESTVRAAAHPGTAVRVDFDRSFKESNLYATESLDAQLLLAPQPLPQGVSILSSEAFFFGESLLGHLLLWIPETANGQVDFNLQATGSGFVRGSGRRNVKSKPMAVSIEILPGTAGMGDPPSLVGTWANADPSRTMRWQFGEDARLQINSGSEMWRNISYRILPAGNGQWLLLLPQGHARSNSSIRGAYRLEVAGDSLVASTAPPDGGASRTTFVLRRQ